MLPRSTSPAGPAPAPMQPPPGGFEAEEIVLLHHLADPRYDGFKPNLMVDPMRGEIRAQASSDIGYLAVACGTALAVLDFRCGELILKEGFGGHESEQGGQGDAKTLRKAIEAESKSPIVQLRFSVCRIAEDPSLAPRLILVRANGVSTVWTLQRTLDMWRVERRTQAGTSLEPYSWSRRLELSRAAGQGGMLPRCLGRDVERCRSPSPSSAPARDGFKPCVGLPSALDLRAC
ncbi:hypothetical protein L1887_48623 [Cichorium endivia]|nr:hypothetical protein L1887_48623 [Cichorium endivia]